jgi:DNA repair protein RadC
MLSLSNSGKLIHTDLLGEGTVNSTGLLPRMVMDVAVRYSASKVILAHNHPGGEALPSNADIYSTSQLIGVLESAGIKLLGHFVVAGLDISDALDPAPLGTSSAESYMDEPFEVAARIRSTIDRN